MTYMWHKARVREACGKSWKDLERLAWNANGMFELFDECSAVFVN